NNKRRSLTPISSNEPNQINSEFANKFRRLRACARCHRLKMRCVFEDPAFESCTRCYKADLKCSMTEDPTIASAKSRPRKKTKLKDENLNPQSLSQIQLQLSELQRLLSHAIRFSKINDDFNHGGNGGSGIGGNGGSSGNGGDDGNNVASSMNSMKDGPVKPVPNLPWIPYELNIIKELYKLNILNDEDARQRYDFFINDLMCYWPCISLPEHYTYDWLIDNEPLVLLGFITVTCLNEPDLHDTLLYYLDGNLAQKVSITGDITVSLIQIYLCLSLWCSPPRKWGSYKHQMSLLTALNLVLCLDLGNEMHRNNQNVLKDSSEERKIVRAYMGTYACCCSLGLSLPRFKVVTWTPNHERCCQILLMGESNRHDRFICYYARLVAIGEEIFQFLYINLWQSSSLPHESLRAMMISYEKRMQKLATESKLLTSNSKERNLISIIYYQLLMTMYDYVVCRVLLRKDILTEVYLQTLNRLIKASEKVIDSFVALCEQTCNFPTFFYYRPMHALVALIRARLLVKSQDLDLEIDVENEYEKVSKALKSIGSKSKVAAKMTMILSRVSKWMKVSNKFNKDGATNSMVDLLDELGKEKAVENIR
ncbi:hypothetical protein CANARDRAFT_178930, partial [[Candida] arabinofermentans NRRL YB-2248]